MLVPLLAELWHELQLCPPALGLLNSSCPRAICARLGFACPAQASKRSNLPATFGRDLLRLSHDLAQDSVAFRPDLLKQLLMLFVIKQRLPEGVEPPFSCDGPALRPLRFFLQLLQSSFHRITLLSCSFFQTLLKLLLTPEHNELCL